MGNKYHEVYKPSNNLEYYYVVDDLSCRVHYFKTYEYAQKFADDFGFTILCKECFD